MRDSRELTGFLINSRATIDCGSSITYRVEESDTDVLDDAVEGHELEHTEGGDESRTSLPGKASKHCHLCGSIFQSLYQ